MLSMRFFRFLQIQMVNATFLIFFSLAKHFTRTSYVTGTLF